MHAFGLQTGSLITATTSPTLRPPRRAAQLRRWLGEHTTTTPGRLLLVSILTVAGAICFGAIATIAEHSRSQAAGAARHRTEPLLVQAVTLYTKLSDANATVTATFVTGGPEPPASRARYDRDLRSASDAVAALTQEVGASAQANRAIRTIIERLPVYAGRVDAARANNRQGLPVGAAYLRAASALLGGTILPAADRLYSSEAMRLSDDYGTGSSTVALVVLLGVIGVALVVLIFTQRFLTRISQRILNLPMVVATLVLLAVSVWSVVGLLGEQSALASARRQSDSAQILSAASVLFSRAETDQSLTLVGRGSDEIATLDLPQVIRRLGSPGGLIAEVAARARAAGSPGAASRLTALFGTYQARTVEIESLQGKGLTRQAITAAAAPAAVSTANGLSANLTGQLGAAQRRFASEAADATSSLAGLWLAIPLLTAVATVLALLGLRQRLDEYR